MEKIRFAIIGSNFIADRFLQAAKLCENVEIRALYSREIDKAKRLAGEKGIPLFFDRLEALAGCGEIDAVYIASPNSCHFEQAVMMLRAGKHVICEKPLASNYVEGSVMFQCARDNGVFLMEAMRPVFHPAYQAIREKLKEIGPIRQATFSYCQYSSRYNKFKQGIVENAFDPSLSNGSIMDIGCYPIHVMVMLFGLPGEILSMGIRIPDSIDGNGCIIADYGEFLANISYSKISDSYLENEIQGENGSVCFCDIASPKNICCRMAGREQRIEAPEPEQDMQYEIREFTDIVQRAEYPDTYQKYSLDTLRLIDEARAQMKIVFPADTLVRKDSFPIGDYVLEKQLLDGGIRIGNAYDGIYFMKYLIRAYMDTRENRYHVASVRAFSYYYREYCKKEILDGKPLIESARLLYEYTGFEKYLQIAEAVENNCRNV